MFPYLNKAIQYLLEEITSMASTPDADFFFKVRD